MTGEAAHESPVLLGERYRLVERIATGGMGDVWRATDEVLHRDVAVKVLKREYADDATARERFLHEARNAAGLAHPNIAAVFDFGEEPGEPPYLVMELVEGSTLARLLTMGTLDPDRARELVRQTAEALGEAHRQDLVHRDVKPGNVLVTADDQVKLTDFGIARAADGVALTRTGEVIGTPHYISPEQAEGKPATAASDVYALGVVLYECLTGVRPFRADTPVATALAHLREPVPAPPEGTPADLATAMTTALAKDPEERFPDGSAMAAALAPAATTTTAALVGAAAPVDPATQAMPAPTAVLAPTTRRRVATAWPVVTMAALAGVLAIALVVPALFGGADETDDTPSKGTPSPSPSVSTVTVREAAYADRPLADVRAALKGLGLKTLVADARRDNPGGHQPGSVATLAPDGKVRTGTVITLTLWGAEPAPATAKEPEKKPGKKPGNEGKGEDHGKPKGKKK